MINIWLLANHRKVVCNCLYIDSTTSRVWHLRVWRLASNEKTSLVSGIWHLASKKGCGVAGRSKAFFANYKI